MTIHYIDYCKFFYSSMKLSLNIIITFLFISAVGGISVKEHFELNVKPFQLQMSHRLYHICVEFFFSPPDPSQKVETPPVIGLIIPYIFFSRL